MAQVCFDSTAFYTIILVCVATIVYTLVSPRAIESRTSNEIRHPLPPIMGLGDLTRMLHPMVPPYRRAGYHLNTGIPTRGPYGPFHAMGFLHNAADAEQAMPLMGRRIHSNQYEYYTFHHSNPNIKIPIKEKKEIDDGATINLQSYPGVSFRVSLYDTDQPAYTPFF